MLIVGRRRKKPKTQTFSFSAPEAESVLLVGDFTEWQQKAIPLEKDQSGLWTTTLKLPHGAHKYLFIVDGVWCDDPACTERLDNPFGGHDNIRRVA
jgi:1,4-alpha-glucan branching enzyme